MSEKSHIVTDALLQYAKTKKDKVKYEEGHEQEAEEKIRKLDEKHWDDFEGKGDTIKDAACAKADALDAKRRAELTSSKPKLKAQYRLERFNKTTEDKDESGNPYNPVKTTIAKEIEELQKKDSDNNEDDKDKQAEEEQNAKDEAQDKEEEAQTEKQKKNTKEKHKKKSKETKQKKLMKTQNSPQQIAKVIGKMKDAEVDEYQNILDTAFEAKKIDVEKKCKERGYELGEKDVTKYNKKIRKLAEKQYNLQKKTIKKAEVKSKTLVQKLKLKIGAMLGL